MRIIVVLLFIIPCIDSSKVIDTRSLTEKQGRDVILSCRFEQLNENDRVMWSKDGVILSVKNEISGDRIKYEILGKYDLIIKNVLEQDNGQYICQNFDQNLSIKFFLTILIQPTKPDIQQINESLIENSSAKFLCITHGGYPFPTFKWFINDKQINESFYKIYPDKRRSYSELSVRLEKTFHNSSLSCQIENQALEKPLITLYKLNIQYKPEVNLYSNETMISNLNLLVIENEQLTIDCQIDTNPRLMKPITWLKNTEAISGMSSSSLIFPSIKRIDDGEYRCIAVNAIGHGQSSVQIRVQYAPIVRIDGGGIINENERLVLVCNVDSYPSIDYHQWYKNNEKLNVSSLTSSVVIEKVSKEDTGNYICMVKNTLKYSNGSLIEKFNKTQTKVLVQYSPKVSTQYPLVATDNSTTTIKLQCEIDSNPDSIIHWKFNNKILFNSNKYSIIQNKTFSYLILQQIQHYIDYGFYICNASNKLGYNSTIIQLRSKDVPESPKELNVINVSYSMISIEWKEGFDGGWNQSFSISLNNLLTKQTNETYFTFTNLRHLEYYNITVRAFNRLGYSLNNGFIRVQTNDVPIRIDDLPLVEYSLLNSKEKTLHYRLNNSSFLTTKVPLCIRIEIFNQSSICQRIVTSSGMLELNEYDVEFIRNISICIDQYEDYCGESVSIEIKRPLSFDWIFIIIASIIIVIILILIAICIFYLVLKHRQRRTNSNHSRRNLIPTSNHVASQSAVNRPTSFFSNVTYPEQQQVPSSYTKLPEIENKCSNNLSLSNPNLANLTSTDQYSTDNCLNDTIESPYITYNYPLRENPSQEHNYAVPIKNNQLNKKTIYEVVV